MIPGGKCELIATGGAQAMLTSVTAELQIKSGGLWTSYNPKQIQTANTNSPPNWAANGWSWMGGGASYRVVATMTYQEKLAPADPWTTKTVENTGFAWTFP